MSCAFDRRAPHPRATARPKPLEAPVTITCSDIPGIMSFRSVTRDCHPWGSCRHLRRYRTAARRV